MELLSRAVASGLVIAFVTWIAKSQPSLGGWMLVFPANVLLVLIWLRLDGTPNQNMTKLVVGALGGMLPTAVALVGMMWMLQRGHDLPMSAATGIAGWLLVTLLMRQLGLFGG
jgi:uncharacterized membrane protein (GlpM family)